MNRSPLFVIKALPLAALMLGSVASAQLLVTYAESPDATTSSLSGTSRFTFNELSPGYHTDVEWAGTGTFDKLYVLGPDQYGGAIDLPDYDYGSNYSVQSQLLGGGLVATTTITLDSPHAYFGFWWSAGDATNVISFYNGDDLVAAYTTESLLNALASEPEYKGNPRNRNEVDYQSYAFINFLGLAGTTWDTIVMTNDGTSGFEADNFTDREAPWTLEGDGPLPGIPVALVDGTTIVPVPEPSAALLAGAAGAFLAVRRRRSAR